MINIVEFKNNILPRRWTGKKINDGAGSMLSTPFKKAEKSEKTTKFSNSNLK